MNKNDKIEFEVNFNFQEFLHNKITLDNLIGNTLGIKKLKKIISLIHNNNPMIPMKILLVGSDSTTITAHAFLNSLQIENVTYIESSYINVASSKHLFRNSTINSAVIMAHIGDLNKLAKGIILQYLKLGYYKYENRQTKQQESMYANGFIILTAKTGKVAKEIVDAVDFTVKLRFNIDIPELEQILIQRLEYMKINYGNQVLDLMLNSCNNNVKRLMDLLRLSITNIIADSRVQLLENDVKWAIENIK